MATEQATDVSMENFDFTTFLQQNTQLKSLFPLVAEEGPVGVTMISPDSISIYGDTIPGSMVASLEAAMPTGNHWAIRVLAENAYRAGALIGIFALESDEDRTPFLGIASLRGAIAGTGDYSVTDISPVYSKGGVPINPNKFSVDDAMEDGGDTFFLANTVLPSDTDAAAAPGSFSKTMLLQPLALIYRKGPENVNRFSIAVTSQNVAPLDGFTDHTVVEGGNLRAGTYTYRRVPVTANGLIASSVSEDYSVTLTPADIQAGRRAIRLDWDSDPSSVRGCIVYRDFTPASGSGATESRLAELSRVRTTVLDDTFRAQDLTDADEAQDVTKQIVDEFSLVIYEWDTPVETIPFTFRMEANNQSAAPIDRAVNYTSNYVECIRLYEEDLVQGADTLICYSTPRTLMLGGRNGDTPTEDDLERCIEPFLNRDRFKCGMVVDLGWCSPYASMVFAKIEEAQRCHSLLSVPYAYQSAQGSVAYTARLSTGSRRSSIYTPWMKRQNPETGTIQLLPGSVFASQVQILSDLATAGGAGRSFAGLNRGVTDALGVEHPDLYEFTDEERDLMVLGLVNYFRRRDSAGMVLWENITLQRSTSAASNINVSRLWDIIQNAISDFLEYSLHEPNDEENARSIRSGLNQFLNAQVLVRNLGNFEVVTDGRAGNNNASLDQGIRNIDVYLTPVIAARRYRCRTILTRQGATYADLMQIS